MSKVQEREAKVKFTAQDKMSPTLQRIQNRMKAMSKASGLDKLRARFNKLNHSLKPISQSLRNTITAMSKFSAVIGGIAIAAGIKGLNDFGNEVDRIAKLSKLTGFTGQQIQDLSYAGSLLGVSADESQAAMKDFSKRLGEARQGTGSLYTMLNKTNPALLDQVINAKSSGEAFEIMISAMRQSTDMHDRNALAVAAFGRSGQKMSLIARENAEDIQELINQGRRLRGPFSDNAAALAESYEDAKYRLSQSSLGIRDAISVKLLPVLNPLIDKFSEWNAANRELIASKVAGFVEDIANNIQKIDFEHVFRSIQKGFETLQNFVDKVGGIKNVLIGMAAISFAPMIASVVSLSGSIFRLGGNIAWLGFKGLIIGADNAGLALKALRKQVGLTYASMMANKIGGNGGFAKQILSNFASLPVGVARIAPRFIGSVLRMFGPIGAIVGAAAGLIIRYWEPIKNFASGFFQEIWGEISPAIDAIKNFGSELASAVGSWVTDKIVSIGELFGFDKEQILSWIDGITGAISNATSFVWDAIKGLFSFRVKDYSSEREAEFAESGRGFARFLIDGVKMLFNATPLGLLINNWSNIGEAMSQMTQKGRDLAMQFVEGVKSNLSSLQNFFTSLPSKIIAWIGKINLSDFIQWPSLPPKLVALLGLNSSQNQNIEGRAVGGNITENTPYIVGENGPELIFPSKPGWVMNNDLFSKMQNIKQKIGNIEPPENIANFLNGNIGTARQEHSVTGRGVIDINLNNAPQGTKSIVKEASGLFGEVRLNTGRAMPLIA